MKSLVKINLEKPCVGMFFDEEDDVHKFYTDYARSREFDMVRRISNLGIDGKLDLLCCPFHMQVRGVISMLASSRVGKECNTSKNATP